MPREIITLQCGQCGNQIGCRFWDLALREHASHNTNATFDHALSSFFRNVDTRHSPPLEIPTGTGNSPIRSLKARAVLIDMEEGVIKQLISGHLGDLFDTKQYITGNSGSGNNWAQGHEVYGPEYADDILEKIRKQVELCDSLQSFVMLHSLGGGTGSGIGSYIVELLHDAYPQVYQFSTSIFPSVDDDVVTSPYNSLLATVALAEYADCVLPIENQALLDILSQKENTRGKHSIAKGKVKGDKPFDSMNGIAANLLLHLTSSMRFEGSLNVDLNEITTNLVPYPKLHFLVSSMAPHSAFSHSGSAAQQHRAINQLFTEVFMRDNQLIKVDPTRSTYLACALLMRGNGCTISDLHQNVARIKHRLTMAHWNTEGFKVGLCSQAAVHTPRSLLCLANNTCIGSRFIGMRECFKRLYKRRVYVHHYAEYMDISMFDDAYSKLEDLIADYEELEFATPPMSFTRLQPVLPYL